MSAPAPPAPTQRRPPPAAPPPPPENGGSPATEKAKPPTVRRGARPSPARLLIMGVEGWGKTSIASHAPNPIILMARGETGYETLCNAGLVPEIDSCEINSWPDLLAQIDYMAENDTGHKTIILDALVGFERLNHEYVCNKEFDGDWSKKGFLNFQQGPDVAVTYLTRLTSALDRLRLKRGISCIVLSHVRVKPFNDPMGTPYDRYEANCHAKTWSVFHGWADAVLFGKYDSVVVKEEAKDKKGKGIGGTNRVLFTQHHDAYDAKNRYGMPKEILVPTSPKEAWENIQALISKKPEGK